MLISLTWHSYLADFGLTKAAGDGELTHPGRFAVDAAGRVGGGDRPRDRRGPRAGAHGGGPARGEQLLERQ